MKRSLFTSVGFRLAQLARPQLADLHVHTLASDGDYTPTQVVTLAWQAGLAAVAVSDHDTLAAVEEARTAAGDSLELIPAVEISTGFVGRELHLLGYFTRTDHPELNAALGQLCETRRERFHDFLARLADRGTRIPEDRVAVTAAASVSLGRRHVAGLLESCGFARTRSEAFQRFLSPLRDLVLPKTLLPIEVAIGLVRDAGGTSSLAHPPADFTEAEFRTLAGFGLDGLEAEYPWGRNSPRARLREIARRLGLAVTGGSDCHGPLPPQRRIGSCGITWEELAVLRDRRGSGQ